MAPLFWFCVVSLIYCFVGYSALIELIARLFPNQPSKGDPSRPLQVSVVLVVYNGARQIRERIENLLAQDYPILEIIVVSDGSDDGTDLIIAEMTGDRVKLISRPSRAGKAACLTIGIQEASGDLVVLADVRQRFRSDTVSVLAKSFFEERIGAVSGALEIHASSGPIGKGVGAYWNLEKRLRHAESLGDSCIGCTGAVYAIRRALFQPIPSDTLLDDVVIPMQIALSGQRVIFNPDAIAYDPQALDPDRERIRKRRTLAGNFQMLFRYPQWMLPWRNRLWWQLISHKYLRLLGPFLLAAALVSSLFLLDQRVYRWALGGQIAFYLAAILGRCSFLKNRRLFSFASGFVFLNLMVLNGFASYLTEATDGTWAGAPETEPKK